MSLAAMKRHVQAVHGENEEEESKESTEKEQDEDDSDYEEDNGSTANGQNIPIIKDVTKWMSCEWETEKEVYFSLVFVSLCCDPIWNVL